MDIEKLGELIGTSVASGTPLTAEAVTGVLTDDELLAAAQRRGVLVESAGSLTVAKANEVVAPDTAETDPQPLTPEEAAFKEFLLEGLGKTYRTYASAMNVMNDARGRREAKLPVADLLVVKAAAEVWLTDDLIRGAKAEVDRFTTEPIEKSPPAGFNLLPLPNANLTGNDETALANHVQSLFSRAYEGNPYHYEPFHNYDTAHRTDGTGAEVTFVLAPDHLNLPPGTVKQQKAGLEAHNADPTATTTYITGSDAAALLHIKHLADNNAIDTTTQDYVEARFWATNYRDVQAKPVGGFVPRVCVYGHARVYRDRSDVRNGNASRTLVVTKA